MKTFYYNSCRDCRKKLNDGYCEKCENEKEPKAAYNFNMKVSDGTESMWVHVFNNQGEELLGMTAEDMKSVTDYKARFNALIYKVNIINEV